MVLPDSQLHHTASEGRPAVCRQCGSIVRAGENVCAQCGAPVAEAAAQARARRPIYDMDAMRFARAVLTRPAPFTIIFIVANIFVFMLMWASSGIATLPIWEFPYGTLLAYGAKTNELINRGEWWRFVTPMFLHVGLVHLLVNMYGLWMLGPYVERFYGSAKFVVFWVATGVAGVLGSYLTVRPDMHVNALTRFLFKTQDVASAGASGALFGLVGVLFVFGIKYRRELPDNFKRAFGTGMMPTILLNLFIGFSVSMIDNAAHMGGLVAGAALALVVDYKRPGTRGSVAIFWHILQALALALVAVSFLMVALNFNRQTLALDQNTPNTAPFIKAINDGEQALDKILNNRGEVSDTDRIIKEIDAAPRLDEKSGALLKGLKSMLERARDYQLQKAEQRSTVTTKVQLEGLRKDFSAWEQEFNDWIKTDGAQYGIKREAPKTDAPRSK
jgi:rhomboid protease GluP